MSAQHLFDPALLQKYNTNGPRYTSYPTALSFDDSFFDDDLIKAVKTSPNNDLSLYLHIPFCHSLCYYCGCNKIVTRHNHKATEYLTYLFTEISQRKSLFNRYKVKQIHLGGGTPSFLSEQQIANLMGHIRNNFSIAKDAEVSIEIDPRNLQIDYIDHLANIGFNRLSIGVQDIDSQVQKAINRIQSTKFVEDLILRAKQVGFHSVNVDLIYGLPHQTPERFLKTLAKVIDIDVDRISLFSYAHLPERFAAQRKLRDEWLPNPQQKLALMQLAIESFLQSGYQMIGMDHFAKNDDKLALAQKRGELHRNFQGYTTHADADLLGLGVSSISHIGECYSQNYKDLSSYYQSINETGNGVNKGLKLSFDDQVRGYVIAKLMCNLRFDKQELQLLFDVDFDQYLSDSIDNLQPFIKDKLVQNAETHILVEPRARLLIRNICMAFDNYIKQQHVKRFSRVI